MIPSTNLKEKTCSICVNNFSEMLLIYVNITIIVFYYPFQPNLCKLFYVMRLKIYAIYAKCLLEVIPTANIPYVRWLPYSVASTTEKTRTLPKEIRSALIKKMAAQYYNYCRRLI